MTKNPLNQKMSNGPHTVAEYIDFAAIIVFDFQAMIISEVIEDVSSSVFSLLCFEWVRQTQMVCFWVVR